MTVNVVAAIQSFGSSNGSVTTSRRDAQITEKIQIKTMTVASQDLWPAICKKIPNFEMLPKYRNSSICSEWFGGSQPLTSRHGTEIS